MCTHLVTTHQTIANYQQHVESYCLDGGNTSSPINSIEDVLARSPNTPLTPQEMKLTTSLVRRQLSQESNGVLEVKTGGQVMYNN